MDAPEISQFDHTRYYCGYSESWKSPLAEMLDEYTSMVRVEENVYRLCKKLCSAGIADSEGSDLFVVFISNDKKQIPLWHQKASHRADGVILWDYHVICVQRKADEKSAQVWDLDSTLPFPSPLTSYISETFRPSFPLFSEYQRFYRIIHAPLFLRYFASDRRHMKDSNGNWNAEPPTYNPIVAEDGTVNNLNEYMEIHNTSTAPSIEADMVNIVKNERLGVVVSENQLEEFFTLPH